MDLVGPLLERIATQVAAQMNPRPRRVEVAPGAQVAWDECCEGLLWSRLVSMSPSGAPYPQQDQVQKCGVAIWAATIGVGILRCASVVDDNGEAPTAAALTREALQMTADMATIEQALRHEMVPALSYLKVQRWEPLGPSGGCVGGEWQIIVGVNVCGP